MSIGKKNDLERIDRGEIIRVRNRIQSKKGKNKIPNSSKQGQQEGKIEEDGGEYTEI